ncbi:hypothetical protein DdX_16291 [Ditylenchus destructor]|uniref:Uncharacterized protein n=1 Tax=Ditylenchus destructor TaxID=166010 RepID=A0AAD4MP98_9BILA|nr:hypothetical protein DdX_16291 [Ditylenchus destructor]
MAHAKLICLIFLICFVTTTEINALPMSDCIAACDAAYGSCVFAAMLTTFGLGTVGSIISLIIRRNFHNVARSRIKLHLNQLQ